MSAAIGPLTHADLPEAARICRVAFGTFLGAPDPENFWADRDYVHGRFGAEHVASFAAELDGAARLRRLQPRWIVPENTHMTRLAMVDPAEASGRLRTLLNGVAAKRGRVPSMVRVLGSSPAALGAYLSFNVGLGNGVLSGELRERIAIAVANANTCATCLAAHTQYGREDGISDAELDAARAACSADPSIEAALQFAMTAMRTVGHVTDDQLTAVRAAGFDDAAIIEIMAVVFINVLTNAVNHVAETEPDCPAVAFA